MTRERSPSRSSSRWATPDFDFEATWRAVEPDDVLTLIYTSGTTGPAEGRAAHAPQPDGGDPRGGRPPPDEARRAHHLVPPVRTHRGPVGDAVPVADGVRVHGHVPGRPARDHADPARGAAHRVGLGPAHLGEAEGRAGGARSDRPGRAAGGGKDGDPPEARARRVLVAGGWRRAHAGRGARLLRGARPADLRAVGHVGDLVLRHDQPARTRSRSGPAARR